VSFGKRRQQEFDGLITSEILERRQSSTGHDSKSEDQGSQHDLLQRLVDDSPLYLSPSTHGADWETISNQIMLMNLKAVHTTSFAATNALLDILAAPPSEVVLKTLHKEALDTMDNQRQWTTEGCAEMRYLDSALRESARKATIQGVCMTGTVTAAGGVTTPDGLHLPHGCMVGTHAWARHHDAEVYSEPTKYRPFRFITPNSATTATPAKLSLAMSDVLQDHLSFGFPSNPCPGRYLAAQQLKILMAYVLTRYDIQMVMEGGIGGNWNGKGRRPESEWWLFGSRLGPPAAAKVRVRRRAEFR
jgi:cytochrome P450